MAKFITRVEQALFESRRSRFVLLVLGIELIRTGIWVIPNIQYTRLIAVNPFANPFLEDLGNEYNFWNWLGPFVAWLTRMNGEVTYVIFNALFAVILTALLMWVCFDRFSERSARTSVIIFQALPVSGTVFFMIGMDAITVFLMLLILVFRRFVGLTFVLSVLLGMQHFEQGLVAALSILLFVLLQRKFLGKSDLPFEFGITWVVGLILGKLVLYAIIFYFKIPIGGNRASWFVANMKTLGSLDFFHFHQILWSAFGPAWGGVVLYANRAARDIRPFFIALAFLFCFLLATADETRVFSIVSFPLLTVCWLFNEEFKKRISQRTVTKLFVAWVVLPWSWVWGGVPRWSAFPYDLAYIRYLVTGHLMHVPAGYPMFLPITVP